MNQFSLRDNEMFLEGVSDYVEMRKSKSIHAASLEVIDLLKGNTIDEDDKPFYILGWC